MIQDKYMSEINKVGITITIWTLALFLLTIMVIHDSNSTQEIQPIEKTIILNNTIVYNVTEQIKETVYETKIHNYTVNRILSKRQSNYCTASDTGLTEFNVKGLSMHPTFFTGDVLLIKPFKQSKLLVEGDIIVFEQDDELLVHRIQGVYYDLVLTKGDNNLHLDKLVLLEDIQYVVCGVLYS